MDRTLVTQVSHPINQADRARYRRFSAPKSRAVDQQFIDLFETSHVWDEVVEKGGGVPNLPEWGMLTLPRRIMAIKGKIELMRDTSAMWGL
jgi:tyrosine-protein phosphatase SIW14